MTGTNKDATQPIDPPAWLPPKYRMLKIACLNIRREDDSESLFSRWGNLYESSLNLSGFLTSYWPDSASGGSLLESCLKSGFASVRQAKRMGADDKVWLSWYVNAVLKEALRVMDMTLVLNINGVWKPHNPLQDPFLSEIIKSGKCAKLHWVDEPFNMTLTRAEARLLCAARLFSFTELDLAGIVGREGGADG